MGESVYPNQTEIMERTPVRLTFVGDIFPANLSYSRNCGVASLPMDEKNRGAFSNRIKEIVAKDSLLIGNLESPILPDGNFRRDDQFAGCEGFVAMLKEAGVDLVSLANNHILEHGEEGLQATKDILRAHGIEYIGTNEECGEPRVAMVRRNGWQIAFVAYNAIDNREWSQSVCVYNRLNVAKKIKELKHSEEYDKVCLILHWGDEFIFRPSASQMEDAHMFVDSGADFVICSHPHVVQPVERYHGGLICYSLGNFIFDMKIPKATRTGMMVEVKLDEDLFTEKISFVEIQEDFFPKKLRNDGVIKAMLAEESVKMEEGSSDVYKIFYDKEKKRRRMHKRIAEKVLLVSNWHKYSPRVRREFIETYKKKLFGHGNN